MLGQKLDLLEKNLNKKDVLLKKMEEVLDEQLQLLEQSELPIEELDACMEVQGTLTQELELFNEEADELFDFFKTADMSSDSDHVSEIARIREVLRQITNDFAEMKEKEQRARQQMEAFFEKERKNFGAGRRSSKAALDYYKSMSGSNVVPPQFMDQKK